ncbi:UvrD-helicase domain-containing protein [Bacteroides thetaiotaomicron]|uniref:UvrD-helicase domain-containing protein n=1 Tax=Bacteroides thetaiotaomicron TaxID=818 RepID=UPI003557224D
MRQLNHDNNRSFIRYQCPAHQLVKDGDSSFVFEKIGTNIRNVMIDEFQDTSRCNGEISNCSCSKGFHKEQTA